MMQAALRFQAACIFCVESLGVQAAFCLQIQPSAQIQTQIFQFQIFVGAVFAAFAPQAAALHAAERGDFIAD